MTPGARAGPACVTILVTSALAPAVGEDAVPGRGDLDALHPSLRAPVESIAPDGNAEAAWAVLGNVTGFPSDEESETLDAIERGGPVLGPERREELRRILDPMVPLLEAFHRGASRGSYVPGAPGQRDDLNLKWRLAFTSAVRLECLRARLAAGDGDFESAARSIEGAVAATHLLEKGLLIDFRISHGTRSRALSNLRTVAAHPDAPISFLSRMLAVLDARPAARLAEAIRLDFRAYTLPLLLAVPETPDPPGWPETLRRHFSAIDDGDAAAAGLIAGHLLDGHRRPFDRRATLALYNAIVLRNIERAERPPREADPGLKIPEDVEDGYEAWPEELRGVLASKFEGTARDLAHTRARLREVENPLGKLMVYQYARPGGSLFDWRSLRDDWLEMAAHEEASRTALGIRIHEVRSGEPPRAVDDLVAAKILERLPLDPFSGEPLRWSRGRRILWSVGKDLEDNGGVKDRRWEDDDDEDDDGDEASGPFDLVFDVPAIAKDRKPAEDRR